MNESAVKKTLILFITLTIIFIALPVFAHPGRTASDGCHYCRTNCDSWGVPWGERHCHGGGYSPPSSDYSPPPNYSPPPPTTNYVPQTTNYDYSDNNTETEDDSWVWYIIGALGIGGTIYWYRKLKNK